MRFVSLEPHIPSQFFLNRRLQWRIQKSWLWNRTRVGEGGSEFSCEDSRALWQGLQSPGLPSAPLPRNAHIKADYTWANSNCRILGRKGHKSPEWSWVTNWECKTLSLNMDQGKARGNGSQTTKAPKQQQIRASCLILGNSWFDKTSLPSFQSDLVHFRCLGCTASQGSLCLLNLITDSNARVSVFTMLVPCPSHWMNPFLFYHNLTLHLDLRRAAVIP